MDLSHRIDALEKLFTAREPEVLAFVPEEGRFDRLRQDAEALENKFPNRDQRPAIYGTLIGVKDIFHVDGFPTRAGSQLPPDILTGPESDAVSRLKAAGALIVGKTVTTEFAYFAPGPTRNPHNPAHTPGGSSSGSAAGVAVGLCEIALGTQTIGSVNRPAAFCGVVGYKPSYDRIPRAGLFPFPHRWIM
ncbi:MAG: amidase [Anaerolineae bacterium]|nr:amidase [Anaerolineae bacterium]